MDTIQKIAKEIIANKMEFVTDIPYRDIDIIGKPFSLNSDTDLKVKWSFDVDARSYGIKTFYLSVTGVEGQLVGETDDENLEEAIDIKTLDFKVVDDLKIKYGYAYPTSVTINFKTKTIEIS